MNHLKSYGILFTALILTSCALTRPQLPEVNLPPERMLETGYSFVPLNEKGWMIAGRDSHQLALMKSGTHPDETFAVQATPYRLPAFKTSEEFINLLKAGQDKDTNSQRFNILKYEVTADTTKTSFCARTHMMAEDRGVVKGPEKLSMMILEAITLTCAHPKDNSIAINLVYSHRYYPGQSDPAFVDKASIVLNSLEFSDF
ncbi:MAG: hypothetical protein HYZ31_10400 [Gammaproteobacteria bacterium]|jgi:hypothetical protein|nr:hypothetical protein [Gammaproteobacteria bacterium]